ncbi:extracellular solute-binding protein [Microvirga sp. VF16]|uniref:extracellular solute-binding protein n=1 Tax=Microvirga sp. VF16 TaxID=2807101 RepID=UPI00193DA514|nr:extracellular solute-binding protein [Microvirga sp. VF16]QRM32226.1 extracellular solute-binding protein [Microvirga sp. VF16]
MKTKFSLGVLGLVSVLMCAPVTSAAAESREVVLAIDGGAYERVMRENWLKPFAQATGIKVVVVSTANPNERRAQVQAMEKSGNVTWDIFAESDVDADSPSHSERAANIDEFCKQFTSRSDLLPGACKASGVLAVRGMGAIVYNKEHFPNGGPTTWKEFWDTKAFPGVRAMPARTDAWRQLMPALMADGASANAIFPMDVDRGFRKLDELRPHVGLWWTTSDQAVQGFRNGDYDAGFMWMVLVPGLIKEGQPIAWSYNGAIVVGDRYAVVKNAPHKAEALELLKFLLDTPTVQGKICEALFCTPPSTDALAYISEEARAIMPSAEQVKSVMATPDGAWLNTNQPMLVERWNKWIQK